MTFAELNDVSFWYDSSKPILKNISVGFEPGSFSSLVGRSGTGKSTLLRLLSGLIEPVEGVVTLESHLPKHHWKQQSIAFLTQRPTLLPWLTVRENILLPANILEEDHEIHVEEILRETGLQSASDKRPKELSGGMLQRAMLGMVLAMKPKLLLLDEPYSALDEITREQMIALVKVATERTECTTIMATHNLRDATSLSDFIVSVDHETFGVHTICPDDFACDADAVHHLKEIM